MDTGVIVALIGMASAVVTTILTVKAANRATLAALDKKSEVTDEHLKGELKAFTQVTETRLEELTREVRQHNDFATRVPVLEEKMKVANNRIKNLEMRGTGE